LHEAGAVQKMTLNFGNSTCFVLMHWFKNFSNDKVFDVCGSWGVVDGVFAVIREQ